MGTCEDSQNSSVKGQASENQAVAHEKTECIHLVQRKITQFSITSSGSDSGLSKLA